MQACFGEYWYFLHSKEASQEEEPKPRNRLETATQDRNLKLEAKSFVRLIVWDSAG
jgi:hypothetical protein